MIAVFTNYAKPNFLAALISNSVLVAGASNSANFLITIAKALFIIEIKTEAITPNTVIATSAADEISPLFD